MILRADWEDIGRIDYLWSCEGRCECPLYQCHDDSVICWKWCDCLKMLLWSEIECCSILSWQWLFPQIIERSNQPIRWLPSQRYPNIAIIQGGMTDIHKLAENGKTEEIKAAIAKDRSLLEKRDEVSPESQLRWALPWLWCCVRGNIEFLDSHLEMAPCIRRMTYGMTGYHY